MGNATAAACALVLFVSLVVCASSVSAQCTPLVYVFRHAEDTNPPEHPDKNQFHPSAAHPDGTVPLFALTPTGKKHADLYPAMVTDFEATVLDAPDKKPCPVTKVYAATKADKTNREKSATNAFDTAVPLARARMTGADPITTVANGSRQLYEFLSNNITDEPTDPDYNNTTSTALRAELIATAILGQSSAIFWTSQGMHVLGGAIIGESSHVPKKDGWTMPPRNAVYIFEYDPAKVGFHDTPKTDGRTTSGLNASVWVQCFNHIEATLQPNDQTVDGTPRPTDPNLVTKAPKFIDPTGVPPTQRYYCGFGHQSSVGGKPTPDACDVDAKCGSICNDTEPCDGKSNKDIKGKICDTRSMLPVTSGPGIFGACE